MPELRSAARDELRVRLWVVEDSPLTRQHVESVLTPLYDVECFGDGRVLLEQLGRDRRPDVLITDWDLRGISGLDLVRHVRARYDEISLPVLVMTAASSRDSFTEPFGAGANEYLL